MEKSINPHFNSFGGFDITGEWVPTNGCYSTYCIKPYSFYFEVRGETGCYKWWLYLSLTGIESKDIELLSGTSKTLKGAKNNFKEFLENDIRDFTPEIEDWKVTNQTLAFDKDFNYVGTFYTSWETLRLGPDKRERWDYYNENPVTKPFKYELTHNSILGYMYYIYDIHGNSWTVTRGDNKELIDKMLNNLKLCKKD